MQPGFYKNLAKMAALIVMAILLCRVTRGYFAIPLLLFAIFRAMQGKTAFAMCCYVFFPFVVTMNRNIMQVTVPLVATARIGILLLGLVFVFFAMHRPSRNRLPLGLLWLYICVEVISSTVGYSPKISYMKLIFFSVFVLGLWIGSRNLTHDLGALYTIRLFFIAMCSVLVLGSLMTLPFPAVAYPVNSQWLLREGMSLAAANAQMKAEVSGISLFAGITTHSQMLAPLLTMAFGFLMCDMLFVENRFSKYHGILLGLIVVFAFLTRSRTALFSLIVTVFTIFMVTAPQMNLSARARKAVKSLMLGFLVLAILGGTVAEIRSHAISRWIYKGEETKKGSAIEAVTSTRMGAVQEGLRDFRKSPIFGMGFQVNDESQILFGRKKGLVLFAPVEKGLLPMVVIGEGGLMGVLTFGSFLIAFYAICFKRRYFVTMTGFTSMLATNIGEATFFSPGGVGGILWMFALVGGFTLDMLIGMRKQMLAMAPILWSEQGVMQQGIGHARRMD